MERCAMNLDWSEDNLTDVIFNGATPEHRFTGSKAEARHLARIWLAAAAPLANGRKFNLGHKLAEMRRLRWALQAIQEAMTGKEWDAGTMDAVALALRQAGYAVKEPAL